MEKLTFYRNCIQEILEQHARKLAQARPLGEIETQLLFDREHEHYQLLRIGWRDDKDHVFDCRLHLSLKNDKIWIERDNTERGIADELLEHGIPQHDIVLAFHAPYKRPYTEFAAA